MKVGTRVRKVYGTECIGITGMVSGPATNASYDIRVRVDAYGVNSKNVQLVPGDYCDCWSHQWEPIVPEGHHPAELTAHELLPFLHKVTS